MNPEAGKEEDRQITLAFTEANLPAVESRQPVPEFDDSADLRDYLEIVLRRKWLVLTFLLATFVTVLVVSLAMKPVFKAGGKLELSMQMPRVTKFEDLAVSHLQTREFMQTHVKLLQSESLARRVIEKLQLDQHPIFNPAGAKENDQEGLFHSVRETFKDMKDKVKGWFQVNKESGNGLAQRRNLKKIEKWFAENLQVQPERDTTHHLPFFQVHRSCPDPGCRQRTHPRIYRLANGQKNRCSRHCQAAIVEAD